MLRLYIQSSHVLLAAEHIPKTSMLTFIQFLEGKAYSPKTIKLYLRVVIHFARWQHQRGRACTNATPGDKADFLNSHLPSCQCLKAFPRCRITSAAALSHWLTQVVEYSDEPDLSDSDKLVKAFGCYLKDVAGLALTTRLYYCRYATDFLQWCTSQFIGLNTLTGGHLSAFISHCVDKVALTTVSTIANALRCFLRFLSTQGLCPPQIALHVPTPKLPFCPPGKKPLSEVELNQLLGAIDHIASAGKRDYAIVRCLADLGIRLSEVALLSLDDIDWRNQVITIAPGKSRRQHKLPIPNTLMLALVDYVTNSRPQTQSRSVFVYHRAPDCGQPIKTVAVRGVIRRVFAKADFPSSQRQVHRLRYTMATRLLANDVSLKTIADILGHRGIDTTIRYAHVELRGLSDIALPWPQGDVS